MKKEQKNKKNTRPTRGSGRIRYAIGLGCSLLGACPPDDLDTTPPGFVAIQAEYIRVSDGRSTGTEAIPVGGFTRGSLPNDRRLRLVATLGDSESGIASVLGPAEITWTCTDLANRVAQRKIATLDPRPEEERTGTAPTDAPIARNATFLVDPFDGNPSRLICPRSQTQSPAVLRMTIGVRNGDGLTSSTGELVFAWVGRAAEVPHDKPIACSVFNDGYGDMSPRSEAVYFAGPETACIPDGTPEGLCRRWFGRCVSTNDDVAVTFKAFNDGESDETLPSDAVYNQAPNVACIPDETPTGDCRRWFGLPSTVDGRTVECYLFDDGLTNPIGPTRAIYYGAPGQVCMPDDTATGACRKWFGNCQISD